jgi:hypothetical protein
MIEFTQKSIILTLCILFLIIAASELQFKVRVRHTGQTDMVIAERPYKNY